MASFRPSFTIGIEEEYLLVDQQTYALAVAPDALMDDCARELQDQVSPEFLQCQIEIGTKVCHTIGEARDDLKRLRECIVRVSGQYGLAPIAASCHPFADYLNQTHTPKERYDSLSKDLAGVARRMLICGQHVHVGIEDDNMRIDLMNQFTYFLPHLLALSGSSPFWKGDDTGLDSYRLTIFDNLPRTGLPPRFSSFGEFERSVALIINTGAIEDSTKIWWDIRPSDKFPTLESRICDVSPRLEDTLTIAALTQCIMRMLWRLSKNNQRWRIYDRFLIGENRWRAQRYGMSEGLIDFGAGGVADFSELIEELIDITAEDAEALDCKAEILRSRDMVANGNSASRQRATYKTALSQTGDNKAALMAVVAQLTQEYKEGL